MKNIRFFLYICTCIKKYYCQRQFGNMIAEEFQRNISATFEMYTFAELLYCKFSISPGCQR